jgi:Malate/L-lactate dehydrogenase
MPRSLPRVLAWSDLHGVDSHGISMIPHNDELRRKGRVRMDARTRIVSQTPVSTVGDGGGGLGHVPAHFAMSTVIAKAKIVGMAAAVVRGSAHFRCGGVLHTDGRKRRSRRHGLHISFEHPGGADVRQAGAAWHRSLVVRGPSADGPADMATTTLAAARIRNNANE